MLSFERMVVAVVLGMVATAVLERALYYQETAEKAAMDITVMNMRTGLRYRVAELMLHNRMQEMAQVAAENPVRWLEAPPPNYLGEITSSARGDVAPGSWYFDLGRRQLCYRVNLTRHFAAADDGKTVCYRVEARQGGLGVEGVALEPAGPYRWF